MRSILFGWMILICTLLKICIIGYDILMKIVRSGKRLFTSRGIA